MRLLAAMNRFIGLKHCEITYSLLLIVGPVGHAVGLALISSGFELRLVIACTITPSGQTPIHG
jgi:hypothetical protein